MEPKLETEVIKLLKTLRAEGGSESPSQVFAYISRMPKANITKLPDFSFYLFSTRLQSLMEIVSRISKIIELFLSTGKIFRFLNT